MYAMVPMELPGLVSWSTPSPWDFVCIVAVPTDSEAWARIGVNFARPKSRILAGPRSTRKIFAGFDVAMHDPLGVRCVQAVGNLDADFKELGNFQRLAADAVLQRLAFEQFHGDEGAAFVFADVVNGADVGMIEQGSGARFAAEALDGLRVLGNIVGEKFQCDAAAQARVFRFVNDAHATAAQFFQDGIVGNGLTDDRGGVWHWA